MEVNAASVLSLLPMGARPHNH